MSIDTMMVASKITALLIFLPLFVGISFWAYRRSNKEKLESMGQIPFLED